jgi:hypothetical protein
MTDIDAKIAEIKSRIDNARMAKARAEATKEAAQQAEAHALAKLADEFGLDNPLAARAKLAELQNELQMCLDDVTTHLDKIEL